MARKRRDTPQPRGKGKAVKMVGSAWLCMPDGRKYELTAGRNEELPADVREAYDRYLSGFLARMAETEGPLGELLRVWRTTPMEWRETPEGKEQLRLTCEAIREYLGGPRRRDGPSTPDREG